MVFNFKLIDNKKELTFFKKQMLDLFRVCFNRDLDERVWHWTYVDNVIRDSIVSLCFDNKKLIGHYAVIPIPLRKGDEQIKTCLSIALMVDSHYRRRGIFIELAKHAYDRARALGFQLAMAFPDPNKNSLPGFKKRLGWEIESTDYVALLTKEQLLNSKKFKDYLQNKELLKLDLRNKEFLEWRLSKPLQTYHVKNGVIIKDFENYQDIVFIDENYEKDLEDDKKYHILIDATIDDFRIFQVFEYQLAYKLIDESLKGIKFKKDLLMSDVF